MKLRIVKIQFFVLIATTVLMLASGSSLAFASNLAVPIKSTVVVNGESVAFDAYNINGENYFKLRDLAYSIRNSEKRFSVGYDALNDLIYVTSGEEYLPVGGELGKNTSGNKTPNSVSSKILKDGHQYYLTSYRIDGSNFFKLRDIATVFDIEVGWDGAKNTITLSTNMHYTAPTVSGSLPYLNTYYLMVVGMTVDEANSIYGQGTLNQNVLSVIEYPQGFFVAPILNGSSSTSGSAVCSGIEGDLNLLIWNCPQTVTFSELNRIFGTASLECDMEDTYYVVVPYAGYKIMMDSDSNGNVDSNKRFTFNPANGKYDFNTANGEYAKYNYEGVWSEGVFGEHSFEQNFNELTLRNISKNSLNFDLFMSRGIVSTSKNITATSTDGIVYTATFKDEGWEVEGCTAKITIKDGRVFLEASTYFGFSGELFR